MAALLFFGPAGAYAQDFFEFHLSNDFSVYNNNVSGPGSANSILTEGTSYLEVLGVTGKGQTNEFTYDFYVGGQMTDDPTHDIRRYSLVNFSLNAGTPQHALSLGDTFQAFSQYTLTTALKGGAYKYLGGSSPWLPKIIAVYGLAAPRWDSIWGNRETKTTERRVYGTRIAFEPSAAMALGFNWVGLHDTEPIEDFERVYDDSRIYSMDIHYRPIPGLALYGEAAFNDVRAGIGDTSATERLKGHAVKIRAVGDEDPSRVIIEYERIDPEFDNPVGSATPDREKVKFGWRYKATRDVHLHTNMLWYRDNLDHQKVDPRIDYYRPEIGVSLARPFDRRYAYSRLTYNKKIARQDGDSIRNDDLINLNYRDRFGIIDTDTNLGYSLYRNESAAEQENNEILYNTVLRSRFSAGSLVIKPAVYLGGWNFKDELSDSDDRFYEYSLGLGVDVPQARITSNIKVGVNQLNKEIGDDSSKVFGSMSIFWRAGFLDFLDRGMLFVQGFINDFDFDTDSRDFREDSIMAGISISI